MLMESLGYISLLSRSCVSIPARVARRKMEIAFARRKLLQTVCDAGDTEM